MLATITNWHVWYSLLKSNFSSEFIISFLTEVSTQQKRNEIEAIYAKPNKKRKKSVKWSASTRGPPDFPMVHNESPIMGRTSGFATRWTGSISSLEGKWGDNHNDICGSSYLWEIIFEGPSPEKMYCIIWKVSPLQKVSPTSKVSPQIKCISNGQVVETPFLKVSP